MAIKIVSITSLQLEVATLVYKNLKVNALAYNNPSIGTAFIDPNSPNRIIYEIADVVDQYFINTSLGRSESFITSDSNVYAMQKAVADIVALVETLSFNTNKILVDAATVTEIFRLALNKTFSENTNISDSSILNFTKNNNDSVSGLDVISIVKQYARQFNDVVAVDDFFGIDKFYSQIKHNVASASDTTSLLISSKKNESISTADAIQYIQSFKKVIDAPIVSDTINVSYAAGNLMLFNNIPFNESTFG
jgi:hypothetical protein